MRKNQDGFSLVEGLLIFIIVAIVFFVGWYVWHSRASKTTSVTLTTPSEINTATFTGKVTADGCVVRTPTTDGNVSTTRPPIGDVGCGITVSNVLSVGIVHGNINVAAWGNLYGFTVDQDITGKQVKVHATKVDNTHFSLSGNDTYVKVLD